ncbi:hypothetical protein ASPWEDRAFT_356878 [Aspergillus wentii DTO 134E9]|uniref:Uncharacterized protein n=1 Tax=Aspergillus wentii DTO 134E9 TaxID=1073089 RepID=A0A1L9RW10_ASPWE|nr:uncharacterized protein ASPWEDRAFT_356878 [Aspergillus wentii DTO 134E9]OJJ39130.1 hypothetical protein ASPWEDRAFT_356878 [Aspergillus wentii DTO 134E9]
MIIIILEQMTFLSQLNHPVAVTKARLCDPFWALLGLPFEPLTGSRVKYGMPLVSVYRVFPPQPFRHFRLAGVAVFLPPD